MEHIVQFAIGIDDDAIRKRILENSEKAIIGHIKQDVANKIFERPWGGRDANSDRDPLSTFSINLVEEFLNEHKDEIIDKAGRSIFGRTSCKDQSR